MPQIPRTTSARPQLLVSPDPDRVVDAQRGSTSTQPAQMRATVGRQAQFGRARMLTALPLNADGPVQIYPPVVLASPLSYLVDPDGNFVGERGAGFVHRLLTARWVEDTRRLGG
jgi:hypothetical protein